MRTLVLVSVFLLSAEVSVASTSDENPEKLIETALAQFKACRLEETVKLRYKNEAHDDAREMPADAKDKDKVKGLSLEALLRAGRFRLIDLGLALHSGRWMRIVNFVPRPEKERLKPLPGENADFDKAMSSLTGSLYIDEETGAFSRIEGKIPAEVSFYAVIKLRELELYVGEEENSGAWRPAVATLKYFVRPPMGIKRKHEHYVSQINCDD